VTVIAGTLTTAWALSVTTYHLLTLPSCLRKLKTELEAAIPDPSVTMPLAALEQLLYLTACIQEGLRLSCGVSSRLQRISPAEPIHFTDTRNSKTWEIPPGTPVGMTSTLLHYSAATFPSPHTFSPELYLTDPSRAKYLVPLSKGSRQCIGMPLAYTELYLALAKLFRVYGSREVQGGGDRGVLQLWETGQADVDIVGDGITPLVIEGSKGIRIKVTK
jgi:cytochrome P450